MLPKFGQNIQTLDELIRVVSKLAQSLDKSMSNGMTFADNMDMIKITVSDSGTADTAIQFTHTLGRSPIGFIPTLKDAACEIYSSGSDIGTASGAVLFCNANNVYFEGYLF